MQIHACEISFLYKVAGLRPGELLHLDGSQVRYFGHVIQMPPESLSGKVFSDSGADLRHTREIKSVS